MRNAQDKTMTATVDLTLGKRQREWVEWALDPMHDHWCTDDGAHARDGRVYDEKFLPRLDGNVLRLGHVPEEVLDDLMYRLGEQAPRMADQEGEDPRPALRVAERIGR